MSDTPRTDEELKRRGRPNVSASFAKTLERDLARAQQNLARTKDQLGRVQQELDVHRLLLKQSPRTTF